MLDRGTLYPAMEVTAGCQTLTTGQLWGGACLTRDPLGDRYLIEKILRLQGAVAGLAIPAARRTGEKRTDCGTC